MLQGFSRGDLLKLGTFPRVASGAGNLTVGCLILVERRSGSSAFVLVGECAGLGELGGTDSGRGSGGGSGGISGGKASWSGS